MIERGHTVIKNDPGFVCSSRNRFKLWKFLGRPTCIFRTEARRRRRKDVQQSIDNRFWSCAYVLWMYVCRYMCLLFRGFSWLRGLTEAKVVPCGWVVDNPLLRRVFSTVGFPVGAWHVIVVSIGLTLWSERLPPQLHVILAQSPRYQNWEGAENNYEMHV